MARITKKTCAEIPCSAKLAQGENPVNPIGIKMHHIGTTTRTT